MLAWRIFLQTEIEIAEMIAQEKNKLLLLSLKNIKNIR
jgi:hypothetical protein